MAKALPQKKPTAGAKPRAGGVPRPTLQFSRINAIWLGAAFVTIAIGYALLARGMTSAPAILLVLGYLVLLPIGIIKK